MSKSFYKNKNVVVTGGLGFIGSNLAQELVKQGAQVSILDARIKDTGWNLWNIKPIRSKVSVVTAPVNSSKLIKLIKNADIVFHLAGVLSHIDALRDPFTDLEMNVTHLLHLLEVCRKHNPGVKIVYTGTRNQYGRAMTLPVTEDHPFDPIDTNGVSEIAAEHYCRMYWRLYGLKSVTLRLCNVFGPRHQMRHSRQGVLNWFLREIMDGRKIRLMGGGDQIRDSVYVDDVVKALLLLGKSSRWGEAFNIGAYPISLKQFVETAIDVYGGGSWESAPFSSERKNIEPGSYVADWSKLREAVGWSPSIELPAALSLTFQYYRENRQHYWSSNDTGL